MPLSIDEVQKISHNIYTDVRKGEISSTDDLLKVLRLIIKLFL